MGMMPAESKTTFMATKMRSDGALGIAVLASWETSRSIQRSFENGNYFRFDMGGSIMAAMSVRKV
jgi:hypothetical protein